MAKYCIIVLSIASVLITSSVGAQDRIMGRVSAAEESYARALRLAKENLIKELSIKASQSLDRGDKASFDKIRSAYQSLGKDDKVPSGSATPEYDRVTMEAATKLAQQYELAVTAYTRQRELAKANLMQEKLATLHRNLFNKWLFPDGSFERTSDGRWARIENGVVIARFDELSRNDKYVELKRDQRVHVRLYIDHSVYLMSPFEKEFPISDGAWSVNR